jgi:hypothetical protein
LFDYKNDVRCFVGGAKSGIGKLLQVDAEGLLNLQCNIFINIYFTVL